MTELITGLWFGWLGWLTLVFVPRNKVLVCCSSDTVFKFRRYRESLLNMALRILSYSIAAITLRLKRFFWWCPSSRQQLDDAERRVLSSMTRPYHGFFVDVGGVGEREERDRRSRIWTVMVDPDGDCKDPGLPLVLVHGYLCGSALWVLNLESFAKDRIVYSIDLPGFGKSSRPKLSKDAALAEEQLAQGKSSLDSLRSRRASYTPNSYLL